jgi:hypothetical protein
VQQLESLFDPLPFDAAAARNYGELIAVVRSVGAPRPLRLAGLLIAATARANRLLLYTRASDEFAGLASVLDVVVI